MDPFAPITGRERPGGPAILRWIPQVYQYQKETAAALSALCGLLALCLLFYFLDARDVNHDAKWAGLPWREGTCSVLEVGVAYRGDCRFDTSLITAPSRDFAECDGPMDSDGDAKARAAVERKWLRTGAGQCAAMADRDYRAAEATQPPGGGDGGGSGLDTTSEMDAEGDFGGDGGYRRLYGVVPRPISQRCNNAYLAWALVRSTNASEGDAKARCAYRFGAPKPSLDDNWEEASRSLELLRASWQERQALPCWALRDDGCVMAFTSPGELAERERAGAALAQKACCIFGVMALGLAAIAALLHFHDHGCCGLPPLGYHSSVPTLEPDELPPALVVAPPPSGSALSDRVMNIMRAAVSRLGDMTPTASGETSLRASRPGSRRTIEVVGAGSHRTSAPRNIAADFLVESAALQNGARRSGL